VATVVGLALDGTEPQDTYLQLYFDAQTLGEQTFSVQLGGANSTTDD
jgi:hypothetical protein